MRGGAVTINATVTDATGNPVNGESLTFTAPTQGTLSALSAVTNTNGQLTVTYTAGATPITETVQASATNGITGQVAITTISAPGGNVSALTLSASASSVPADGTSTVTIQARVSVTSGALAGIPVTFTTTAGSLSPTTQNTDSNGGAAVTLTAASSLGTATVTASAGGFNATTTITFVAGTPAAVQLSANPTIITIGGTSTILAMLTDARGNPVSGQALTFAAPTLGALSALTGNTNTNGQITVVYTAGTTPGTETLTATANTATGVVTGSVALTIASAPQVIRSLTAANGAAGPVVANGTNAVAITATVDMVSGSPAGITVTFATTAGTFGGTTTTGTAQTNSSGVATLSLIAPTSVGTATVTASASGFSGSTAVTFVAGAPTVVQLSASSVTVNARGTVTVTATVTDATGNPVNGESLTFTAPTQGTLSVLSGVTNTNGQLTVTYTAGATPTTETVRASATNGITGQVAITTISAPGGDVSALTLSASASSVPADGTSTVTIQARVSVTSGALAGIPVTFATTAGSLSPTTRDTDANGGAAVTLTAASSLGTATVTASAGGFNATTTIMFVAGTPATVRLSANPTTVSTGGTSTILAMLTDARGNPVSGQALTFAAPTLGALSALTGNTNTNGQITVVYTAGTTPGTETLTATANTATGVVTGSVALTIASAPQVIRSLTAANGAAGPVVANGTNAVAITATVDMVSGSPAGITVTFVTTAGTFGGTTTTGTAQTNSSGVATLSLIAPTSVGTATVTASASGFSGSTAVTFVAGAVAVVQLTANLRTVTVNGIASLAALVTDAHANPVASQTIVFSIEPSSTSHGSLDPQTAVTDTNGRVPLVTYTASATPGIDTVQARAVNGTTGTLALTITPIAGAARIDLLVSSPQLDSDGLENVTLTALLRDTANNVLSGVPVSFAADSGSVQVLNGTTGITGTATALLSTGGDRSNRPILLTATAGTITTQNTVQVTGTTLTLSGANAAVLGAMVRLSILLRDSGGTGIAQQLITIRSSLGNPISPLPIITDAVGSAEVDVTANVPGIDTIQVSALGAVAAASLSISADNFVLTAPTPAAEIRLQEFKPVTLNWKLGTVPQVGKTINFFASRGGFVATVPPQPSCPPPPQPSCPPQPPPSCSPLPPPTISAMTNCYGDATVCICSDNAGPSVISAAASVSPGPSSQVEIEFVATTVASVLVQASPTTLGVNLPGSNAQQSIITAVLRDPRGNLVKNQTVSFSLNDISGGSIAPAAAVTDSFGQASSVYTAGAASSAQDGVIVTAAAGSITDIVTLTVAQQQLFVVLGTGNLIIPLSSTQYALPYSVLVTDANGNAVDQATVLLDVLPTRYQKGCYGNVFAPGGACIGWGKLVSVTTPYCKNEDDNLNGILDPGEDFNSNTTLEPGNVAAVPVSVITDASGFALFNLVYAREFTWVEVALEARTVVAGSEGASQVIFFLPGLVSDFDDCLVAPPGQTSPYGRATTCDCDELHSASCLIFSLCSEP